MDKDGVSRVLFVCTANRCRSPIAEALLRQRLPSRTRVEVMSAGLLPGGGRVPQDGLQRIRRFGIDLSGHVSRQVTPADVEAADLVLTMTRVQVRYFLERGEDNLAKCFTFKDFVRRGEVLHGLRSLPELSRAVADGRGMSGIAGNSADDDVMDPMGRSGRVWTSVVRDLADLADRLALVLAPLRAPRPAPYRRTTALRAPRPR
jgi:protein-tyrosine-phosphatase